MASNVKSGHEPAPPRASAVAFAEMIGDWVRQATEGFIATEKILLDLAAQQNALALTMVRERLGLFSPTPSKAAMDLSGRGIHNFFEAQRLLLEMLARQNMIVADGLKPGLAGTPAEALADIVHRGFDNFVTAEKKFMDIFEAEAEGAVKDFGDKKSFDTARLTNLAREGMHTFIVSQKNFLEIVEKKLANRDEDTLIPADDKKQVDLFDMAKQSVDSFVEAQKHLLDLVSDQIDVNVKIAREVLSPGDERRAATTLPDIVKKSVDSFVAAQKALVELASKPRKGAERVERREREAVGAGA
jgi:hypothetical protein